MNSKFYNLTREKQDRIINAGYYAFSQHSYKKTSMQNIAQLCDISKSLLFHYFRNKKKLYIFLFETAVEFLNKMKENYTQFSSDFFEIIHNEIEVRIKLMKLYPYVYQFVTKVYFEDNPDVYEDILHIKNNLVTLNKMEIISIVDNTKFRNPADVNILYDIIIHMSEGFMAKKLKSQPVDTEEIETESKDLLQNLRKNYYLESELI